MDSATITLIVLLDVDDSFNAHGDHYLWQMTMKGFCEKREAQVSLLIGPHFADLERQLRTTYPNLH
jgi:hypothetical protein